MEKIAKYITNYIVHDTELDYDVVKYGIDAILSTGLCFSIALIVCGLLGNFLFGILFIIFLTPIKMQFTSYHCKTMLQCIITYSSCSGIILLIYRLIYQNNISIPWYALIIILILIAYLAKRELNKQTITYLFVYLLLGLTMYFIAHDIYLVLLLSLGFETILILLSHTKKK